MNTKPKFEHQWAPDEKYASVCHWCGVIGSEDTLTLECPILLRQALDRIVRAVDGSGHFDFYKRGS